MQRTSLATSSQLHRSKVNNMPSTKSRNSTKWHRGPEAPVIRDFVTFSMGDRCTDAAMIEMIAEQLHLRVESYVEGIIGPRIGVPEGLDVIPRLRGEVVFGSAAKYLDEITTRYQNLRWNIADGVLRFSVVFVGKSLSQFDEVAGRLMAEARPLDEIAAELDKQQFRPKDHIERSLRTPLAEWNQKYALKSIKTFTQALNSRLVLKVRGLLYGALY